jgi:PTS system mannose-specific IIA component
MIGIIVVTHGGLAQELVAATQHVVGPLDRVLTICVGPDDDLEKRRAEIKAGVADVDSGRGVIIVTDMFGGTPANLAVSQMEKGRVEVIAGANLPLLIRLAEARDAMGVADAAEAACEAGRRYIAVASRPQNGDGK